ncbi:MAG: hypothetical protein HY431_00200 [Candidatus Levybacteria bacterium]|nr:hypothetical protein [Candidatus Levybacteria bacterium]
MVIEALRRIGKARIKTAERQVPQDMLFSQEQKEALVNDGAVIYLPTGVTIMKQEKLQLQKGKPSFWYVTEGGDALLALPSRRMEVAIYPDPERFFVPGTFDKDLNEQERLAAEDGQALSQILGIEGIMQIIPAEASSVTEVAFQRLDGTGIWLFGEEYAAAQGLKWVYGRTKNPTNRTGSFVADVGGARSDSGLDVNGWHRDCGFDYLGAVRWVVPSFGL